MKLTTLIYFYPSIKRLNYEIRPCVFIGDKQWLLDPIDTEASHINDLELGGLKAAIEAHGIVMPEGLLEHIANIPDYFNYSGRVNWARTKYYDFNSKVPCLSNAETPAQIPSQYDYLVNKAKLVGVLFIGYSVDEIVKEISAITDRDFLRKFIERLDQSFNTYGGIKLSEDEWAEKITPSLKRREKTLDGY